jgi:hypothetical protein
VAIASEKCLLLPGDTIITNNLTMPLRGHTILQALAAEDVRTAGHNGFFGENAKFWAVAL